MMIEQSTTVVLVCVPAGAFDMGSDTPPAHWDERPIHRVTISSPFLISQTSITIAQYRQFKPDALFTGKYAPFAAGVSWHDAVAFCEWLSAKVGKPYRLPTEAEWEFAARTVPELNMRAGPRQWCRDWYGEYSAGDQIDPVGPDSGIARVVRGGVLDEASNHCRPAEFARPTNRAAMAPAFGPLPDHPHIGRHCIGFRVVQAPMPTTKPTPAIVPIPCRNVTQTLADARAGAVSEPYFRKRQLLPMPPDGARTPAEIAAAGLHPSLRGDNHSPALEVLPNGDLLAVYYSSFHEYDPGVGLIATRLRHGADEWDPPALLLDFPGVNDHAPLLWNDGGTIWLFWGCPQLAGTYPFQYTTSNDNGATWSEVKFPHIVGPVGELEKPQPINTAFRINNKDNREEAKGAKNEREGTVEKSVFASVLRDLRAFAVHPSPSSSGTIYIPTDAKGGQSMLWASDDDGRTWRDTGGRTFGRHTTFVELKDGRILGMGGKNAHIDGYMAKSISRDGGRTYEISKTPFPALTSGQRPSILRLASGRLFFAGDFQNKQGEKPATITDTGCYVALSDDEGETWHIKKLIQTQRGRKLNDTLGYSVARQSADGLIHIITSRTLPAVHYELNEAWILSSAT